MPVGRLAPRPMARGDEKNGETPEKRTPAEVERAEARAAERARREARRRAKAARRENAPKKDGPGLRERAKAIAAKAGEARAPAEQTRGEVIQRRIAAIAILVVAAVVIMAITDAAPFFYDTSEEERVADTVERFFAAYGDGDFETVCDLFSPSVTQSIESAGATETKGEDPESCAEILEARVGTLEEDENISVKVDTVRVSGPRAIANLVLKTPDSTRRQMDAVELEMGPEGWLLTSPVITR
jgi:ketosteroid isomerase-like protein